MAHSFLMPKLGHLMEEATVLCWRKQVGERVVNGEILLEVETVKAIIEVESDYSGVVLEILVPEGEEVPVGMPLAVLGDSACPHQRASEHLAPFLHIVTVVGEGNVGQSFISLIMTPSSFT